MTDEQIKRATEQLPDRQAAQIEADRRRAAALAEEGVRTFQAGGVKKVRLLDGQIDTKDLAPKPTWWGNERKAAGR